jgi:hypothetical protein
MDPSRSSPVPLKNKPGAGVAGGGEPPYDGGMEHRMTALETRLETILPTLATKADVEALRAEMHQLHANLRAEMHEMRADLRADMQKTNADIKTWALATMIAIIGTVLAGLIGVSQLYSSAAPQATAAPVNMTSRGATAPAAPAGSI